MAPRLPQEVLNDILREANIDPLGGNGPELFSFSDQSLPEIGRSPLPQQPSQAGVASNLYNPPELDVRPSITNAQQISPGPQDDQRLQDAIRVMDDLKNAVNVGSGREMGQLEAERLALMEPAARQGGWQTLGESLLGQFSTGDPLAIPSMREARRQKALDIKTQRYEALKAEEELKHERARQDITDEEARLLSAAQIEELQAKTERTRGLTEKESRPEIPEVVEQYRVETADRPDGKYLLKIDKDDGSIVWETKLGSKRAGDEYVVAGGGRVFNITKGEYVEDPTTGPEAPKPGAIGEDYTWRLNTLATDQIDRMMPYVNKLTTGLGSLLKFIPGTDAKYLAGQMNTLSGQLAFGELTRMRQASETGGALGQVSDKEGELLAGVLGAIDSGFQEDQVVEQLNQIRSILKRWQEAQLALINPQGMVIEGVRYVPELDKNDDPTGFVIKVEPGP